ADGWQTMAEAAGLRGAGDDAVMTRPCELMVNGRPVHQDGEWPRARRDAGREVHRTRESEIEFAEDFAGLIGFATEGPVRRTRGWRLTAHPVAVTAVRYIGLQQTYDLAVEGKWHNFVANGVVVHNSFNEFSMRYAKATDDFYVPESEDVRSQVGKPGAYSFEPVDDELAERTREELRA